MSSRIHSGIVYYDCYDCGLEIEENDVCWATHNGELSVQFGDPYCDACLPEKEDESDNEPQGCSHCFNPEFSCACSKEEV